MKKSILKSVVSVFAAATMLITSANLVLAENDYMSYSNDFSSATGVTTINRINGDGTVGSINMAVEDGVLKSTRTSYDKQDGSTRAESGKAVIEFGKSFSTGKIQAKFDFTMNSGRAFVVAFDGYQSRADKGLLVYTNSITLAYPNGSSFATAIEFEEPIAVDGTEYTLTVTLDIASGTFTGNIVKKNDPTDVKPFTLSITEDGWGGETHGAVTGLSIWSTRAQDLGTGTMTFDNLSVDAYTETNYEVNSIYRSNNGLETNKVVGTRTYTFKGLALSKLTNFVDANASFITAAYDDADRMIAADVKAVSEMDSTPAMPTVEGATVKSFVLDMTNANPLMPVYLHGSAAEPATTMRKVDFEEGFGIYGANLNRTWGQLANIDTYETYYHKDWPGVSYTKVAEGNNNVLKIERATFVEGGAYNKYDTANSTWIAESAEPGNNHFVVKFDKASDKTKVTFKFKFEGTENSSQTQYIELAKNGTRILISRNQSGAGTVQCGVYPNAITACTWTDMKAGEWYTFTGEMRPSGFTCSVAGNFTNGYAVKTGSTATVVGSSDYITIGSDRTLDIVSKSLAEVKTPTSVWYIDDVVVEY